MELLIVLLIIVFGAVLPIFLWTRSKTLTLAAICLYILFIVIYWDFVQAKVGPQHDTVMHGQVSFAIIDKWVSSGVEFGWCPYLGAGQPMSVFLNFFLWNPEIIFSKIFNIISPHLSVSAMYNLVLLTLFFIFCTGSLMLLHLLYNDNFASILGFGILLFGGLFIGEIDSAIIAVVMVTLPWLLFFMIHSFKTKRWGGLFFFSLVSGVIMNRYVPLYIILTLMVFSMVASCFCPRKIFYSAKSLIRSRPYAPFICIVLFLLTSTPAISSYNEIKDDYISPTRGLRSLGAVSLDSGSQVSSKASISTYVNLFDEKATASFLSQEPFYIGIFAILLLFCIPVLSGAGIFIISAVVFIVLGLGCELSWWRWIIAHIPFAGMIRHTFHFSRIATFFTVIAAMSGLKVFLKRESRDYKLSLLALVIVLAILLTTKTPLTVLLMLGIVIFLISIIVIRSAIPQKKLIVVLIILGFNLINLAGFSIEKSREMYKGRDVRLKEIKYPSKWTSAREAKEKIYPFDFWSIFEGRSIWINQDPNQVFLVRADLIAFLMETILIENPPIEADIFHLFPEDRDLSWEFYFSRVCDAPLTAFCQVKTDSNASQELAGNNIIDRDADSYWEAASPKLTPQSWIEILSNFVMNIDAIRVTPRAGYVSQLWKDDHAELEMRNNMEEWELVQKLDLRKTAFNGSDEPILFKLEQRISTKSIRILVDDDQFLSLAEVELIDNDRKKNMEELRSLGRISRIPSDDPNRVGLTVHADRDAVLLRLENYHKGWKCFIDGKEVLIRKLPPNFQVISIPKGEHEVIFEFSSTHSLLMSISIFSTIIGCIAMMWWLRKSKMSLPVFP